MFWRKNQKKDIRKHIERRITCVGRNPRIFWGLSNFFEFLQVKSELKCEKNSDFEMKECENTCLHGNHIPRPGFHIFLKLFKVLKFVEFKLKSRRDGINEFQRPNIHNCIYRLSRSF